MSDTSKNVLFRFKGNKRHLPRQGSQFFPELTDLCRRAGLLGTISVGILNNYTDLRTQEGLHVNTPRRNGVPVSWHNSDKEAVQVLITGYNGMNKHELYQLLLKACGETQEKSMPKPPDTDAVLDKILGGETSSQEAESQETLVATEGEPTEIVAPTEPAAKPTWPEPLSPSQATLFFTDPDNTRLFLLEIAGKANSEGELSTADCVAILRNDFGFPKVEYADEKRRSEYNEPYAVLSRLIDQGLLIKGEKRYRRLTPKARELMGEQVVQQPEEKPEEAAPETPAMLVSDMLNRLTALAQRVEAAKAQREQLAELDARRVEIVEQQRALQDELDRVVAEIEPLALALQDPSVKADEAAYAAVEILFKG